MTRISVSGAVFGAIPLLAGLWMWFADQWLAGTILVLVGFIFVVVGLAPKAQAARPQTSEDEALVVVEPSESASQVEPVIQPVTKEVYRETIIREIVKIRCRNCGTAHEERLDRCPHCGAPP